MILFRGVEGLVLAGQDTLLRENLDISPGTPIRRTLSGHAGIETVRVWLEYDGQTLAEFESKVGKN